MRLLLPLRVHIFLLGWTCLAAPVEAHEPLKDQVLTLTRLIETSPARRDLLLLRADRYRREGFWSQALQDISQAERLGASPESVAVGRANVYLDQGRPVSARVELQLFPNSRSPELHILHAEALKRLGRSLEALEAMDRAIGLDADLGPEIHLERARLLLALEPPEKQEALAGLERALTRMGPVPALSFMASEIACDLGKYDLALELLDPLMPFFRRPEALLARRGDILEKAGRGLEAQTAYTEALARLELAPASPASNRLGDHLRKALKVSQ
jgi:tetratricopeptide (TPR) repeat protein